MLRHVSATPCPVSGLHTFLLNERDSIQTTNDDSTANIEFTVAFGGSLRNARPRRRKTITAKGDYPPGFAIHEDEEARGNDCGRSTLAQPARRSVISQPPLRPK